MRHEFFYSKRKLLAALLLLGVSVLAALVFAVFPELIVLAERGLKPMPIELSGLPVWGVQLLFLVGAGVLAIPVALFWRQLRQSGPAIVLDATGVWIDPITHHPIPWHEIYGARTMKWLAADLIQLDVPNYAHYTRQSWGSQMRPVIGCGLLDAALDDVQDALRRYKPSL